MWAAGALAEAPRAAGNAADVTLFRVFLTDGTAITSYGEYARVGDRVIFSMPIGADTGAPTLHLVTLPASAVDWTATERYADRARYTRYVETRGDADFAALNNEIARVLAEINAASEPARRLELALGARRSLVEWPGAHFGYRAHDIAQIQSILDEVISELRAETGGTAFDLSFVATVSPPELLPPLAPAGEQPAFDEALAVARLADAPAERMSLLEAVAAALGPPATGAEKWREAMRASIATELAAERKIDAAYALVARRLTRSAAAYANHADVAGVARVLASVDRRDQWLGRKRPDQVRALVDAIEAELEKAQRLRLAWDRWELRGPALRKYQRVATDLLRPFEALRARVEQIERLAGPSDEWIARLIHTCETVAHSIRALSPPDELATAHALVLSGLDLASTAARMRREAVRAGSFETARDASSAAAGALMLVARARADMNAQARPPVTP